MQPLLMVTNAPQRLGCGTRTSDGALPGVADIPVAAIVFKLAGIGESRGHGPAWS